MYNHVCLIRPLLTSILSVCLCISNKLCVQACLSTCVRALVSCSYFAVPPLCPRRPHGADHRGDHGGAAAVATGDERLHCHLREARPIGEPGACLCTVGGGEVQSEQGNNQPY